MNSKEMNHANSDLSMYMNRNSLLSLPGGSECESNGRHRRAWSLQDDCKLKEAVSRFGTNNWSRVSEFVGGGRGKAQCSQRWARCLDPRMSHDAWTHKEDKMLLDLIEKYGTKAWMRISREMGTRCDSQCRYRYYKICQIQEARQKMPLPSINNLLGMLDSSMLQTLQA